MLGAFVSDFNNPRSALVWLARAVPSRTGKLAVPRHYRLPKSSAGQGGYCTAFNALGLCLREADTSTGHWHSWYVEPRRVALKAMQQALMRRWRESPNFQEAYLLLDPSADIDAIDALDNADSSSTSAATAAVAATSIAPASSAPLSSPPSNAAVSGGARSADVSQSAATAAGGGDADGALDDGIDSQTARNVTMALASFFHRQSSGAAADAGDASAGAHLPRSFPNRAWALKDSTLLACIRAARNFNSTLPDARQSADKAVTAAKSDKQVDQQPTSTSLSTGGSSGAQSGSKKRKHEDDNGAATAAAPAAAAAATAAPAASVALSSRPPSMSSFSSEFAPSSSSGSFPSTRTAVVERPPALSTESDSPHQPASLVAPGSPLVSASPNSGAPTQQQLQQLQQPDTGRRSLPAHKRRNVVSSPLSDSATESRQTGAVASLAEVAIAAASGAADAHTVIHARRLAELEAAQQAQLYLQCHAQAVGAAGNSNNNSGANGLTLSSPSPSPPFPLLPPSDLSQSPGGPSGIPLAAEQSAQLNLTSPTSAEPAGGAAASSKAPLFPSASPSLSLSPSSPFSLTCDGAGGALPSSHTQQIGDTATARA